MTCLVVPKYCQHLDAKEPLDFDWTTYCAKEWVAGEVYTVGERVRAPGVPGYEFECTAAGQSGARDPKWKSVTAADQALSGDGSVTWISRPISNASLARTISDVAWSAPDAVEIATPQVVAAGGEQKARAVISAAPGAAAGVYRIKAVVTFSDNTVGVGLADIEFES